MPIFYRLNWMNKHENIQGEIITNPQKTTNFKNNNNHDTHPDTYRSGNTKTESHHTYIRDRIKYTITDISEGNSSLTVTIDDKG